MLRTHDALGIVTMDTRKDIGKALATVCLNAIMIFVTETLPMQFSLDDGFISLFIRTADDERQAGDVTAENSRALNESFLGGPGKNRSFTVNIPAEKKEQPEEDEKVRSGSSSVGGRQKAHSQDLAGIPNGSETANNNDISTTYSRTKRQSLKEYMAMNMSLEAIRKRIKGQIVTSEQIKLQNTLSTAEHKLGKVYDAELEQNAMPPKKAAVRVIEFAKIPSYLLENLYLEFCYRKETEYEVLTPLVGISCEPPKLYIVMPKYKMSLNQYIYEKEHKVEELIKVIKYELLSF